MQCDLLADLQQLVRFSLPMLRTDTCIMVAESIGIIYDSKDAMENIELASAFFAALSARNH